MRPLIRKEPKGVVLIISPFNYPVMLALGPLVCTICGWSCLTEFNYIHFYRQELSLLATQSLSKPPSLALPRLPWWLSWLGNILIKIWYGSSTVPCRKPLGYAWLTINDHWLIFYFQVLELQWDHSEFFARKQYKSNFLPIVSVLYTGKFSSSHLHFNAKLTSFSRDDRWTPCRPHCISSCG